MSAASEVILPRNFDIRQISYGQPKQQATGAKTIYINYGGKQCYLQTPEMKAPFGVSVWPSDNGGPDKYSLDLSFEGRESREQLQTFFDSLLAIDKRLVNDAMENSQLWFKKKYPSVDVVEALYSPTVKYSKDRETGEISNRYAPTFKMSLPFKDGKFQCPCYGSNREEVDLMEVIQSGRSKGARVKAIVQISAVWIVGNKFGPMLKVRQLMLSEPVRLSGFAFQSTEEDAPEEDEEDEQVAQTPRPGAKAVAAAAASGAKRSGGAGGAGGSKSQTLIPESDDEDGNIPGGFVDDDGIEP